MKFNRSRLTMFILDMANKYPRFFPKKVASLARSHHSKSWFANMMNKESSKIKKISCFEGDFEWNGVSVSSLINDRELIKIKKWILANKKKLTIDEHSKGVFDLLSFDKSTGWTDIGTISINRKSPFDKFEPFYVSCDYFKYINISLTRYSSGLSFITLHVSLNDNVVNLIKDVESPGFSDNFEFSSFNFLSKKSFFLKLHMYASHFDNIISKVLKDVNEAAISISNLIFKDIGIKKRRNEFFSILDFHIKKLPPYFNSDKITNLPCDTHFLYPSSKYFLNNEISIDSSEEFMLGSNVNIEGVDMIHLNIYPESEGNDFERQFDMNFHNIDSHLAMAPVYLVYNKLNSLSDKIGDSQLYNGKDSIESLHEKVFEILQELQMIDVWQKKLKLYFPMYVPCRYHEEMNNYLENISERVADLNMVIKDSYALSENRVQINNIKYNKFYSKVVLALVITQVLLALMTIDFTKKDTWYAPIVGFFMEF